MRNIYQRFVMQPAPKDAIARRLLGAPGRVTGVAPTIQKSNAPNVFFRDALSARNMVAPSGMSPYPLGAQGGLAGLGAMPGEYPIIAGTGFNERWAMDDWAGAPSWLTKAGYEGRPSDSVMTRAEAKAAELKAEADLGNIEAERLLQMLTKTISNAADALDRHTKTRGTFGYGSTGDAERARLANGLNAAIKTLANITIPRPTTPAQANVNANYGGGGGYTPPSSYNPGYVATGGGTTPGGGMRYDTSAATGAATAGGGVPTPLLALGAVVVLGAGAWLIKRKKG